MKRVLFFALLLGFATLHAQNSDEDKRTIPKGTWNLGGSFAFGFNSTESDFTNIDQDVNASSISIFPNIGYTVSEDWMIGLKTGYGFSKTENVRIEANNEILSLEGEGENLTITPYVRRYFGLTGNLLVQLQGELGYRARWNESIAPNSERSTSKDNQYFAAIRPGVSFFVSDNLALESFIGALQYSSFKSENDSGETRQNNNFSFNLDSTNLLVGISYYF